MREAESIESRSDARYDTFSRLLVSLQELPSPLILKQEDPTVFFQLKKNRGLLTLLGTPSYYYHSVKRKIKYLAEVLEWTEPGPLNTSSRTDAGLNVHHRE